MVLAAAALAAVVLLEDLAALGLGLAEQVVLKVAAPDEAVLAAADLAARVVREVVAGEDSVNPQTVRIVQS